MRERMLPKAWTFYNEMALLSRRTVMKEATPSQCWAMLCRQRRADTASPRFPALYRASRQVAESSTAWRTKEYAGTRHGSFARKRICGVRGSGSGTPSRSSIAPTVQGIGRKSGPTSSVTSPVQNLLRRLRIAFPASSQLSTTAQICHSRR